MYPSIAQWTPFGIIFCFAKENRQLSRVILYPQMPTVLTTRAIHSPTIFFSAQNDGKERNGNNGRRQSLKPSSSNDRSSKGQQRYQQISTSIGKPTKDIVIARENIGTTVSLTAAAFGIGYFLGSNQNAWLTQILNKLPFSRNKPVDMAEVVVKHRHCDRRYSRTAKGNIYRS